MGSWKGCLELKFVSAVNAHAAPRTCRKPTPEATPSVSSPVDAVILEERLQGLLWLHFLSQESNAQTMFERFDLVWPQNPEAAI